jgi:hypothetical protein
MKLACVSTAPCGIVRVMNNVMCISENFEKVKSTIERRKSVTIYVIYVDKMWVFG